MSNLIEKFGRKGTEFDGIFFTEGPISGAIRLGAVSVDSNKQNTNLEELKRKLAIKVRNLGGNALDEFKYVQQGTVWSFSSTRWRASGNAVSATDSTQLPAPSAQ